MVRSVLALGIVGAFTLLGLSARAFAQEASLPDFAVYPEQHAYNEFGLEPLYGPDYGHWEYRNPEAPIGGEARTATTVSWQGFNHEAQSFGLGLTAPSLRGAIYDTLWTSNGDELFTAYGFVSDRFQIAEDRSWILFHIDTRARWWDGRPMTAADVAFTFDKYLAQGSPSWQDAVGRHLVEVRALDEQRLFIRVDAEAAAEREFPFQLGGMRLLDPEFWQDRPLNEQVLVPPTGSGPYRVVDFKIGEFIVYERVEGYWAADHPSRRGTNTDVSQRIDVVADTPARRIAFRAREIDSFAEGTIQEWVEGWNDLDPLIEGGVLHRETFPDGGLIEPQMAFFNLRLEKFQDPRVRQALSLAFDFETANERFFFDQYTRNNSYYINGDNLTAEGPPTAGELALLSKYRELLSEEAYEANLAGAYINPVTNGGGDNDDQLDQAFDLLLEAGFTINDAGQLLDPAGVPFTIRIDYDSLAFLRIWELWADSLRQLGIEVTIERSERGAFIDRLIGRDFELAAWRFQNADTPGRDIQFMFSSEFQDAPINFPGVNDPFVDALADRAVQSEDLAEIQAIGRLFDRHMRNQHYATMFWHSAESRVLYWDKFALPRDMDIRAPLHGSEASGWWFDADLVGSFDARFNALR